MSPLAQLVVLLLALVGLLLVAGTVYVVHRHPALYHPLTAACAVVTVLVMAVGLILTQ